MTSFLSLLLLGESIYAQDLQDCRQIYKVELKELKFLFAKRRKSVGTTPCIDYIKTWYLFRGNDTSNYRPPFFPFTLVSREYLLEIMVSKTVDKLNSTSPVRKQLATIELKVSNLSRKHELAKPVLKQRVLSISLTFSSSRPSISQTYPIFISKRLVGSAARSSNTRRRRRGRRKRRKRARKVANGHYTATIASLSTVCNVTCLRGLARHLRSYRAIILSCIPALCQLSFLTFRYSFPIPKRPAVSSTLFPHFPTPRWNILT